MSFSRRTASTLLGIVALTWATSAGAANIFEGVPSISAILRVDPSVRSVAMGSASGADVWDAAPDIWANPALLGYSEGVRYEHADYLGYFRLRRTTLGYGGIGLSTTGRPIGGLGKMELDASDELGFTFIGRSQAWGAGISLGRVLSELLSAQGRDAPDFTRHLDVALGYNHKRVEDVLDDQSAHGVVHDGGLLVRGGTPLPLGSRLGRIEVAYGFSTIGYDFPLPGFGDSGETARDWRNGFALHFEGGDAGGTFHLPETIATSLTPLLTVGAAMDFVHQTVPAGRAFDDKQGWGAEIGFANVAFGRIGRVGTEGSSAPTRTWGYGFQLPIARFAGARWDRAIVSTTGFDELRRDGWTIWLDPLRIAGAAR